MGFGEENRTAYCPLCATRFEELIEPHEGDEVAVCASCWTARVWYLRGDHDTVIVSPWDREQLEKLQRGELPWGREELDQLRLGA